MGYKVVKRFADLTDNMHVYHVGDLFPRDGQHVTQERIKELKGFANKIGEPLIEEIIEAVTEDEHDDGAVPKPTKLVRQKSRKVARKDSNQ